MLKSKFVRWLVVLAVVAVGITAAAVTGSVPPLFDRPHGFPPPPDQPPPSLSETTPEAAADFAKGIYEGPLGEFFVTIHRPLQHPPCPEPRKRTNNYQFHELYSPRFGGNLQVDECANGMIPYIAVDYAGPGKAYFFGSAIVHFTAPRDRLVLLTIGGHSAIAQLPIPGFPGTLRIAAIERFPTLQHPGILVWIDNTDMSLNAASLAIAGIMGVQP